MSNEAGEPNLRDPAEQGRHQYTEPAGGTMKETWSSPNISTKLSRIAEVAKRVPERALTNLAHHIDKEWLREAHRLTRKSGATGVDGQTAEEYAANLDANLGKLLDRAKSGTYRAPPVRRVHIPKASGGMRPLGIPTFEDKVLQRAVAMVLTAVYEQDFLDCSYGFRPGRSAHQALEAMQHGLMSMGGGWVIELDVRKYFDTVDHGKLREVLRRRVHDGVLLRLIGKWLNAGVLEAGQLYRSEAGTPQGGVISPMLANIYLHDVLDIWFEREVKPRMSGRAGMVRYADDAVLFFAHERDARRVLEALPKRFEKYGLTLHPEKTKMLRFTAPAPSGAGREGLGSFDFLGFTHFWKTSRWGKWTVWRKTAKDRFRDSLRRVAEWCREHRHDPLRAQQQALSRRLRGHYGYFGIWGNSRWISAFAYRVRLTWWRWLRTRSQRPMPWSKMEIVLRRFPLPPARLPTRRYV